MCRRPGRIWGRLPGRWTRIHCAGASPGIRRRTNIEPGAGRGASGEVSAATARADRRRRLRSRRVPCLLRSAGCRRSSGSTDMVDSRVARARLMRKSDPSLPLAGAGQLGPRTLDRSQLADDDADEQQQDNAQVLGRVADGECVARLDQQEVIDQKRPDRRNDRARACRSSGHTARPPRGTRTTALGTSNTSCSHATMSVATASDGIATANNRASGRQWILLTTESYAAPDQPMSGPRPSNAVWLPAGVRFPPKCQTRTRECRFGRLCSASTADPLTSL